MHRCVHLWTIHVLNQMWDYDLAALAIWLITSHILDEKAVRPWLTRRRLLLHAVRCRSILLDSLVAEDQIPDNITLRGYYKVRCLYAEQDRLVEAKQMFRCALQGYEGWDPEHESTLRIANNLRVVYYLQGKLVEAEQIYQLVLQRLREDI